MLAKLISIVVWKISYEMFKNMKIFHQLIHVKSLNLIAVVKMKSFTVYLMRSHFKVGAGFLGIKQKFILSKSIVDNTWHE